MPTVRLPHALGLPALGLAALLAAAPFPLCAQEADAFRTHVQPFLAQRCGKCHGGEKQSAGLRFDRLEGYQPGERHLWTLVHEQLTLGEMPPADQPQPAASEKAAVLAWIAAQQRQAQGGGVRRLNRREFAAALRDVTGMAVDYAASLPDDGKLDGFDTGAEALQDAADSTAQVLEVARRAVAALRFLEPPRGELVTLDLRRSKDPKKLLEGLKERGWSVSTSDTFPEPEAGMYLRPKWLGDRGGMSLRAPVSTQPGVLRLKLAVSVQKFRDGLPNPRLWVEIGGKEFAHEEIVAPPQKPQVLEYQVQLADVAVGAQGVSIQLSNRVELPYAVDGFENEDRTKPEDKVPGGGGLFRPLFDQKTPPKTHPVPFIVLHAVEVEADFAQAWPPASWGVEVGSLADDRASAARLLELWQARAWRRPVAASEQARFLALYDRLRQQGLAFDPALRAVFQAVLLSGNFRYLTSPGAAELKADPARAQFALASRLSFMLWGAPPDAELRRLAAAGTLREPAVLARQVDRLLADPRSDAFVRPFVEQWLVLGQPITLAMQNIQQQDFRFGRYLKASLHDETVAYFGRILRENRPAGELLSSDWTMLNDILARHYGYEGVTGGELRPVTLKKDDPRGGGLLSHAGIQSMLCWMGENWVIYRGAWTLRQLLDDPPPPPPLEVPELTPSDSKNRGKSFRELLRQHQADERCSVCHTKMDPLGFAFQNFDLSGRWRDVEYEQYARAELDGKIEWKGVGKTRPVDAAGKLPRGEEFASYAQFKELLVRHYTGDVVRGLLKNLVLYGAGRKADVADLAAIRSILSRQQARGYPLQDLLVDLVQSPVFLEK